MRKSKRLSEKRDNDKPDAKPSSKAEEATASAEQTSTLPSSTSLTQPTSSTQSRRAQHPADTAETRRRREEEHYGYNQEVPRPRFENEYKSTPHLNPRGAEFESIRLATRIEEWYRDRVPEDQTMELPAQKGILRISNAEQAMPPRNLHNPDKDVDIHFDQTTYEPPQHIDV